MARTAGGRARAAADVGGGHRVTVVVVDTAGDRGDDADRTARLRQRLLAVREEAGAHGGAVVRVCGHGAVVCFVGPACALRFADAVRLRLNGADGAPAVRVGVHAARAGTDDAAPSTTAWAATTGTAIRLASVAARLAEVAAPGEVVTSAAVTGAGTLPGPSRVAEGGEVAALLGAPRDEPGPTLAASA